MATRPVSTIRSFPAPGAGRNRILVAGAAGTVGRALVAVLAERGWQVRALVRGDAVVPGTLEHVEGDLRDAVSLRAACEGCDAVFSAAGASLALALRPGAPGFDAIDRDGTLRLLEAAQAAGIARFGYVSVFHTPAQADLAYVRAHTAVEQAMQASNLGAVIVRPTGLFPAFEPILQIARLGIAPEMARGQARTNPIHPADLAVVCADAIEGPDSTVVEAGGPDVLTRRAVFELAFRALGKKPRFMPVPADLIAFNAALVRPLDRRLSDLLRFFARVSTTDAVAPVRGQRTVEDYFASRVAEAAA